MNIGIIQYKKGSQSAKLLQATLKKVWLFGKVFRTKPFKAPIKLNWGSSDTSNFRKTYLVFNHPLKTKIATNKIATFKKLKEANVSIPPFTTSVEEAKQWLQDGWKLVQRETVTGYHGAGISVARSLTDFKEAPLYTRYFPKRKEYRVIVVDGESIIFMRKILKPELEDEGHSEIRNADRYIYSEIPQEALQTLNNLKNLAESAIKALELDYGAVDIIYNLQNQTYYVLEINTAFGLGERNVGRVATKIGEMVAKRIIKVASGNLENS